MDEKEGWKNQGGAKAEVFVVTLGKACHTLLRPYFRESLKRDHMCHHFFAIGLFPSPRIFDAAHNLKWKWHWPGHTATKRTNFDITRSVSLLLSPQIKRPGRLATSAKVCAWRFKPFLYSLEEWELETTPILPRRSRTGRVPIKYMPHHAQCNRCPWCTCEVGLRGRPLHSSERHVFSPWRFELRCSGFQEPKLSMFTKLHSLYMIYNRWRRYIDAIFCQRAYGN